MNNMEYITWNMLLNVGLLFAAFCIKNSNSNFTENIVPTHYSIWLMPNMEYENSNMKSHLNVSFAIHEDTHTITLNSLYINVIETETFVRETKYNERFVPIRYDYDNINQIIILYFKEKLLKGDYVLVTNFTSTSTKDVGFYSKSYMNRKGIQMMIAVTQTEGFMARQIFPCWDEPQMKATFDISVQHHKKYMILSNMPEKQKTSQKQLEMSETDNVIWTEFETTPKMSTHLVAIVAFDPLHISNAFTSEIVNIWCRSHLASQINLEFIHDVVKGIIEHLANYTSYSNVPTINIVMLPDPLITKTVSSWALIIYRESDFIQKNEDYTTSMWKRRIAKLIAEHVIRHWFGNLVTPRNWTRIWLRDGFVTFFKSYILNMIFEDWRSMDMLVVKDIHSALYYDIYETSTIESDNETFKISILANEEHTYHAITGKASAILRMLQFMITNNVFQKGIIAYLKDNAYRSVNSKNVWSSMQFVFIESYFKLFAKFYIQVDASSKNTIFYERGVSSETFSIETVMKNYIKESRHPLVLVKRNYTTGETIISQECFSSQNVINKTWWIPLTYATKTNPDFSNTSSFYWLTPHQDKYVIPQNLDPDDWIIVNLQQYGYYRVNYDTTNWQRIIDYLNSDEYIKIHVLNRARLIDDVYNLVRYKKIKGSMFMNLTKYLSRETDYIVWYTVFNIFKLLSPYFQLSQSEVLKSHFSEILGSRLEKIGYEENPNEHDFIKMERLNAAYWACHFGNIKCKSMATSKLLNYLNNSETYNILPHWQSWTYCTGLMAVNISIWQKAKDIYLAEHNLKKFFAYLACAKKPEIIIQYLDFWKLSRTSLTQSEDTDNIIFSIINKHGSNNEILDYILTNFKTLLPNNASLKHIIINRLILHVNSIAQLNKIQNFTENEFNEDILLNLLHETLDAIEVRKHNLEFLIDFFEKRFLS